MNETLEQPADRSALRRSLGRPPGDPMVRPAYRIVAPCLDFLPDPDDGGLSVWQRRQVDAVERAFYTVAALIAAQPRAARDEYLARIAAADGEPSVTEDAASASLVGNGGSSGPPPTGDTPAVTAEVPDQREPAGGRPALTRGRNLGICLAAAVNSTPSRDRENAYRRLEARLRLVCRQDVDGVHRHLPRLVRQLRSDQVDIDWVRLTVDLARWGTDADTVAKSWLHSFYRTVDLRRADAAGETDTDTTDLVSGDFENEMA
ncbi:MAG: type I-E CRISPR-associated protein Cse2/CasB [Micromonosporaceae bacterium]|nr:type I-E CRISPR-associated protein Cse2/CasB [Micromonosporaceae bacterium]